MAGRFSSSKRCSRCFTGWEPGLMWSACSATSLGMPGISDGFQAKTIFICSEEVDERAFLFGGQLRVDPQHLVARPLGVESDLLDALRRLKGPSLAVGVGGFLGCFHPDQGELLGCHNRRGNLAA